MPNGSPTSSRRGGRPATATSAQETLRSAERARGIAAQAAREAVLAAGLADEKSLAAEADLVKAVEAMTRAKGLYRAAQDDKFAHPSDGLARDPA